ncbi:MAG: type IV pilus assembly protein PilM [Patescibacteria group bacterium]
MKGTFARFARVEFAPPPYLSLPTAGVDISTSGIKVAFLKEHGHGLELASYDETPLALGAIDGGEIADRAAVVEGLKVLAKKHNIRFANIALPESRGYLFEGGVEGTTLNDWRTSIEQRIDEYVPLPPAEVVFDLVPINEKKEDKMQIAGIGYARRVVEESVSALEEAGITVRAVESENFALPRALLPHGDTETVLVIDLGKTTTKLLVVTERVPRLATTLDVGGHALTLAVVKHFGVSEEEARRIKAEKGIVSGTENDEYIAAMLSTVSVIREEIARRLEYWQTHAAEDGHQPVTRAVLVGGNATVRGLSEYLESGLKIPVALGDVFVNLASRDDWLPPVDYMQSLAYGTAIGLALREYVP